MDLFCSNPTRFAGLLKADLARYGNVIKAANIKFEH